MADVHDKLTRSFNMSQIKNKNTKPEILVRKFLFSKGFRYRINDKKLPGKPDLVLPKFKSVILIHGCFWHAHSNCKYFKMPKTNRDFWENKILINTLRDARVKNELGELGWKVFILWECELKGDKHSILSKLVEDLSFLKKH
jgi:DNA mismatch endonuclease, patch repair protein